MPDHDTPRTPCLLLDEQRMQSNIDAVADRLRALGVPLRPHVKTCKNPTIARRMLGPDSPGIAVSTLAEAERFLEAGFTDQLYAVGIAPGKLGDVAALVDRGTAIRIVLDHVETARRVAEYARHGRRGFDVLLEVDTDGQRAGLAPGEPELLDAARILSEAGCRVDGVMTHMGGSYACTDPEAIAAAAERERVGAVEASLALRNAGHEAPVVSVGSTPTARFARQLDGITEVRAGVHVFMDLVMAGLGVCAVDDVAISVLTEVIGYRRAAGEWIVDAGWMALSRDRGTAAQAVDQGYGLVCDAEGRVLDPIIVRATSQEHGLLARRDGRPLSADAFSIGDRLRVLPNHACATAAQHTVYHVVRDGRLQDDVWARIAGW